MKLKSKYIAKALVISMFFASPLVYAADDDVIVFGGEFEEKSETPNSENDINRENNKENEPEIMTEPSDSDNNINNSDDENNSDETANNEFHLENNNNANDNSDKDNNIPENIPIEPLDSTNENNKIDIDKTVSEFNNDNKDENKKDTNSDVETNFNINEQYSNEPQNIDLHEEIPVNDINTKDTSKKSSKTSTKNQSNQQQSNRKARFIKLLSDDNYDYYLDREAVKWTYIPYSKTEYMADVWIRMIEKSPNNEDMPEDLYKYVHGSFDDEITDARAKGIIYNDVDVKVLRTKKYFLEHYYIRPKTQQIQFLCELEVIGRPQNAVSERNYDYKNWESLIPGSIEFSIYHGVLSNIGTSKASNRGHMTFIDMIDEYARIALN